METLKVRGKLLLVVVAAFIMALALSGCFMTPKKPQTAPQTGLVGPTIIMVGSYPQNGQTIWLGNLGGYGNINGKVTSTNGLKRYVDISVKNLVTNTTVISSTTSLDNNNEFFFNLANYSSELSAGEYGVDITAYDKYGNANTKELDLTFTNVKVTAVPATSSVVIYFQSVLNQNDYLFEVDNSQYTLSNAGTVDAIQIKNLAVGLHTVRVIQNNGKAVVGNVNYNFPIPGKLSKSGVFLDKNVNYLYSRNGDSAVIVYFQTSVPIVGYYYEVSPSLGQLGSGNMYFVKLKKPSMSGNILFTYPAYKLNVRYYLRIYTVDENGNIGVIENSGGSSFTHFNLYSLVNSYASLWTSAEYVPVMPGDTVTVGVKVKNLENLMAADIDIVSGGLFDSTPTYEIPTLDSTQSNKEVLSVVSAKSAEVNAMIGYVDEAKKTVENFNANGNIIEIKWKVPSNAKPGIYPVYMRTPTFVDKDSRPIDGVHVDPIAYIMVK